MLQSKSQRVSMDLCNRWLNGHRRYANGSCDLPKSSRNLITRNSQGHAFLHRRETIPAGTIKRRLSMGSWHEDHRLHVPAPCESSHNSLAMIVQIKREVTHNQSGTMLSLKFRVQSSRAIFEVHMRSTPFVAQQY
jgi:hypothetical protein